MPPDTGAKEPSRQRLYVTLFPSHESLLLTEGFSSMGMVRDAAVESSSFHIRCAICDGEQIDHQGRRHQKDHESHCCYHDSKTTATTAACSSPDDSDEDTHPTAVAIVKAAVTTVEAKPTAAVKPPTIVKLLRLQRFLLPLPPLIVKRLLLPMRASFRGCSYDGCISRPHFCSSIYPQSRYGLSS
ncbi:hypothetical protein C8J56DRAFT_890559 [Mycena floridula]|nr:hypothetical protein C8J56DRAFT_890559 [Mycena floridula]